MNDILLNKAASIQRCVQRARDLYARHREKFMEDYDAQDATVLNIVRACDGAIDLANHLIKERRLGAPKSSADSFHLLSVANIIPVDLSVKLGKMVGFRNISVHQYQQLNYGIVAHLIEHELSDLIRFTEIVLGSG